MLRRREQGREKPPTSASTSTEKGCWRQHFSARRQIEELNAKAEALKCAISWREENRRAE